MTVRILGILNVTSDSFSDGGLFLNEANALVHAEKLIQDGADGIDVGAVSSNPAGTDIPIEEEISRLDGVARPLVERGISVSVDSFRTPVQRHALTLGVHYLNDIAGFSNPDFYPELRDAACHLIVMHSIQRGRARPDEVSPAIIPELIFRFFDERLDALLQAGISKERLIIDPGMGFFLGRDPDCSFAAINALPALRQRYGLPVLVSVSRKSFLGSVAGREIHDRSAATLAAEIACLQRGANFVRTHRPDALSDAVKILKRLESPAGSPGPSRIPEFRAGTLPTKRS